MRLRATPRLAVDVLNSDFVMGWALGDPLRDAVVNVSVDGRRVGQTVTRLPRPDVAAAYPSVPASMNSGFALTFPPGTFIGQGFAEVSVELEGDGGQRAFLGTVPRLVEEAPPHAPGPFPRQVLDALARLNRDHASAPWTEAHALEAARDLELLARSGSRRLPGLYAYLAYVASVDQHARLVERSFPRFNEGRDLGDKDAHAVASSGLEMLAIAHHLCVLDSHGVAGCLVECGCFKGFSTSILSHACQQLGRAFDVFDSFAGLPPPPDTSYYRAGDFAGSFEEVTANVASFGKPGPVRWHRGFFADSVPAWPRQPIALLWMDVDLEASARDALALFPATAPAGAVFSHECAPTDFVEGRPSPHPGHEDVVQPIVDAFRAAGRSPVGEFLHGNTGAFWDERTGIPVLGVEALRAVAGLARKLAE